MREITDMEMRIIELKGHHKACKYCGTFFRSIRNDAKYCSAKCRSRQYKKRLIRKAKREALLTFFGLGSKKNNLKKQESTLKKVDYARLTFILSFLGFLGSIGFYLGVLREVYSPARDKQKIEVLQTQNEELQKTITILVEEVAEGK